MIMSGEKLEKLSASLSKHLPEPSKAGPPAIPEQNVKDIKDDYEYSRKTYKDLIDKGTYALDGMIELAQESEHPRAYEVLAGMMKNMADITDKLMDLQKKKDDLETKKTPKGHQPGGVTNNNVFVGSTTDLQRMLAKGDIIDGDSDD